MTESESNGLTQRLWESDIASSLTNEAARRIEKLERALQYATSYAETQAEFYASKGDDVVSGTFSDLVTRTRERC